MKVTDVVAILKHLRHIKIKVSLILQQRNFLQFTSIFHTMKINLFQLLKSCIRKIKVNCKNDLLVLFKMEFLWNAKYRTPIINQSFVVYKFTCPGNTVGIMWEHWIMWKHWIMWEQLCGNTELCGNNYVETLNYVRTIMWEHYTKNEVFHSGSSRCKQIHSLRV